MATYEIQKGTLPLTTFQHKRMQSQQQPRSNCILPSISHLLNDLSGEFEGLLYLPPPLHLNTDSRFAKPSVLCHSSTTFSNDLGRDISSLPLSKKRSFDLISRDQSSHIFVPHDQYTRPKKRFSMEQPFNQHEKTLMVKHEHHFEGLRSFASPIATDVTNKPVRVENKRCEPVRSYHYLPREAVRMMKEWFRANSHHPYPTIEEKERICEQTGLSFIQVGNWFANQRKKITNQAREEKRKTLNKKLH